jgi:hypothetical protein
MTQQTGTTNSSRDTNTNRSYIMDGDKLVNPVPLDQLGQSLREAADKYDSDNRPDRAAGVREAAAAFDQAFRAQKSGQSSNIGQSGNIGSGSQSSR